MQLVKEILMAFVGSSARAYGIITFATSEFSLFNDLVPKLQREDERLVAKSPYLA